MRPREGLRNVVIPLEIAFHPKLNPTDGLVYWLISLLDGKQNCFASNYYIAEKLQISERSVTRSITKLKDENIVKEISFDGRTRVLKTNDNLSDFRRYRDVFNERKPDNRDSSDLSGLSIQTRQGCLIDKQEIINKSVNNIIKDNIYRNKVSVGSPLLNKSNKRIPPSFVHILSQYYSNINKKQPNQNTKAFARDLSFLKKLRQGTLFSHVPALESHHRKFTFEEIKSVINSHILAATNPEYESSNKKYYNIYFHEFLLNEKGYTKSWFCKWIDQPPSFGGFIHKDKHPDITKNLLKLLSNGKPIKPKEMNKVIKASGMLFKYFNNGSGKLKPHFNNPAGKAKILWEAVKSDDNIKGTISAGYLCTDLTFDRRLPEYCERNLIFETPNKQSTLYG